MKDSRVEIRINDQEKKLLSKIAQKQGMNATDYIRQKVFINNPDFIEEGFYYELPSQERQSYLTMGLLLDAIASLNYIIAQNSGDEFNEIRQDLFEEAKKKMVSHGYLKISAEEQ